MSSAVHICNTALYKVGAATITSLTDGSEEANICNHFYADLRDAVIRAYPWNFATRYLNFGAPLSTGPTFEFAYAFTLPTSPTHVLKVLEASDRAITHKVVGRQLFTDESSFTAKCLIRVETETEFDALFTQALAARIAAEIAWPLTKNGRAQSAMWQLYQSIKLEAEEIDAQEGTPDDMEIEALFDVRYG